MDIKKDIKFVIMLTFIVFAILSFVGIPVYLVEKNIYCPRFAQEVNLESKYNFLAGGCFVEYNGQWIRSSNLYGIKN